jgi:hypothetical protein
VSGIDTPSKYCNKSISERLSDLDADSAAGLNMV